MRRKSFRTAAAIMLLALAFSRPARADAIFNVTLDTAALTASGDPFAMFFQLTDGNGVNDNTVTLRDFTLGGGALVPGTTLLDGGASGDLAAGVTLTDSSFFTLFMQGFTPGAELSFLVTLTTSVPAGGFAPDAFGFSLLDAFGVPVPTLDPLLADTLLTITIDGVAPTVTASGADPERTALVVGAPEATPVPEPATIWLIGMGASALAWRRRRVAGQP
jgi:hypothetical protein